MKDRLNIIIFLVFVLTLNQYAFSQSKKTDSLLHLLKTSAQDTNRINQFSMLAGELVQKDPDTAIFLSKQAFKLAQKINSKWHLAASCYNLAVSYDQKNEVDSAMKYDLKSLELWKEIEKTNGSSNSLVFRKSMAQANIAILKQNQGNFKEAKEELELTLKNFEQINSKRGELTMHTQLGNLFNYQANYAEALLHYFKSLKLAEETNQPRYLPQIYSNIGVVYIFQSDFDKGRDYMERAMKSHEENGNKAGVAHVLGNIGTTYGKQAVITKDTVEQKRLNDKALDYFTKAYELNSELGLKMYMANNLGNIGNIYFYYAQAANDQKTKGFYFAKTLDAFKRSLRLSEELNDKLGVAEKLGNLGVLFTVMKKFTEAESYLKKAIAVTTEMGVLQSESFYYQKLSELYVKLGDYTKALTAFQKFITIEDTISSEENTKKQTRTEMSYEFDKKDAITKAEQKKELELQQTIANTDKQRQNLFLLLVALIALAVLIVVFIVSRSLRIAKKQKLIIEQQKVVMEEKQKAILDSIHYAKKIQNALITGEKYIEKTIDRLSVKS